MDGGFRSRAREDGEWGGEATRSRRRLTRDRGARRHAFEGSETLERSQLNELGTFVFQWESSAPGKSVFTRENVFEMRELESVVASRYDAWCQIAYDVASNAPLGCVPPLSPIKYFFPSIGADWEVVYDGEGELVSDLDAVVRDVFDNETRAF